MDTRDLGTDGTFPSNRRTARAVTTPAFFPAICPDTPQPFQQSTLLNWIASGNEKILN